MARQCTRVDSSAIRVGLYEFPRRLQECVEHLNSRVHTLRRAERVTSRVQHRTDQQPKILLLHSQGYPKLREADRFPDGRGCNKFCVNGHLAIFFLFFQASIKLFSAGRISKLESAAVHLSRTHSKALACRW